MRIDKLLSTNEIGTRSEIKKMIKQKRITLNNHLVKNGKEKVDPDHDIIKIDDHELDLHLTKYIMLNKPANVISATSDDLQRTVLDLIAPADQIKGLAPVGRLDKDTTGLLLLTNDGQLAHQLLAPQKHVDKTYQALIDGNVDDSTIKVFKNGVKLKDGTQCKTATLKIIQQFPEKDQTQIEITITEGKYHQIKRMFAACGMHVATLTRISMGSLTLDPSLEPGEYRELTTDEISLLK